PVVSWGLGQRPRFTAFFSSAPGTNFVTFLAGIFKGAPVCGLRPVLPLRELTEKVPKPTSVTLLPFFNVETTPSITELGTLLAWTFQIFEPFAILSIRSPLFICVLPPSELDISHVISALDVAVYIARYRRCQASVWNYGQRKRTADAAFRHLIYRENLTNRLHVIKVGRWHIE